MIDYTLPLDALPDPLPIGPLTKPFDVTIRPPGSKSITNRAYVLAALADGESRIVRPLRSDDCDLLLDALCTLGAEARWDGDDVLITGVNGRFPRGGEVNLGDGGTPTRFMIACACLAAEPVVVDGSPRMRERPIAEGVDMLRQLGAHVEYVEEDGRLPVRAVPSVDFKGGELTVGKTASSQFISAAMLIASFLQEGAQIVYSEPPTSESYLRLTSDVLQRWDTDIDAPSEGDQLLRHRVRPNRITGREFLVHSDASSAVYPAAAALVIEGAVSRIHSLESESPQPDDSCLLLLAARSDPCDLCLDEIGIAGPKIIRPFTADMRGMPDGAMIIGAVSAVADGVSHLTGLHTLRVKETDRIAGLANELRKVGCTVDATDDSITIDPSSRHDEPVVIETYNDHRMAMAFAVLGLRRPNISIANPKCVAKSYPDFWRDLAKLYR